MKLRCSRWLGALVAVFTSLALTACGGSGGGGGDSGGSGGAGGGGETAIEGVATPNSVSVVTAKNAD